MCGLFVERNEEFESESRDRGFDEISVMIDGDDVEMKGREIEWFLE